MKTAIALLLGIAAGFYVGQTYGQLQIACAVTMGADDLRGVSDCAGGPRILVRYILTRDAAD